MAQTLNNPDVLTQPIATNGDKNAVPSTNDPSQGLMSQSLGFPPICSTRIADGGKAPRRADFNGAFNLISQHHYFLQNGGTETFRQEVSDAIGGYPINARLWFTDANGNSRYVRSTIQNNTNNFNNDASVVGAAGSGKPWEIEAFVDDLNTKYVTNCITEIPQDIKLEFVAGTSITIKAGSKLYRPNGFESDGTTPKFDEVTVATDIVRNTAFGATSVQTFLCSNGTTIFQSQLSDNSSGTTPPSNGLFYNTTTNTIKLYSGGSVALDNVCLLLAIVTIDASGFVSSIDRVYNGFSCLGSTAFALKGVSGLIPNGRNADGTLNNITYTVPRTLVRTWTYSSSNQPMYVAPSGNAITSSNAYYESDTEPVSPTTPYVLWHDTKENVLKYSGNNGIWTTTTDWLVTGISTSSDVAGNNYKLLSFTDNKQVFRAVDANTSRTVVETYRSGTEWYRVWSDGWIEQGDSNLSVPVAGVTKTLLKPYKGVNSYSAFVCRSSQNFASTQTNPVCKRNTASSVTFTIGGGAADTAQWYACGY